jgi:hypothetical protein
LRQPEAKGLKKRTEAGGLEEQKRSVLSGNAPCRDLAAGDRGASDEKVICIPLEPDRER